MNIGTLAKRSGLTPSRIRYYERAGILKTVQRKANGYRSYPEEGTFHKFTLVLYFPTA